MIVDRDGDPELPFDVDELSRVLDVPELKKTQYVGNDPVSFINDVLPTSDALWGDDRGPVTIYCDGHTLTEVFTHLMLHRFDGLTETHLKELLFIYCMDRDQHEGWGSWAGQSNIVKAGLAYANALTKRDHRLTTALKRDTEQHPIAYSVMKYINGDADNQTLVSTIRTYLASVIASSVRNIESRLRPLHYTLQLERIMGRPVGDVMADTRPIDGYGGFMTPGPRGELEANLQDPDYLREFKPKYAQVQTLLSRTVTGALNTESFIEETLVPVRLLELEDTALIEAYLNAFDQVDRVGLLLPSREMCMYSLNLLQWTLQLRRRGHRVPTPV